MENLKTCNSVFVETLHFYDRNNLILNSKFGSSYVGYYVIPFGLVNEAYCIGLVILVDCFGNWIIILHIVIHKGIIVCG